MKSAGKKSFAFIYWSVISSSILFAQNTNKQVSSWLTNADRSMLFQEQPQKLSFNNTPSKNNFTIDIDQSKTFQTMDGFGFALTGGSAMHIIKMSAPARSSLLKNLFQTDANNIGVSYLRVSIGASDLNEKVFSYDDLPSGETDIAMEKFDLGPDKADIIPVLKQILTINPSIKIMGSPWSPPTWMKTNNDARGGRLKPEYYGAYATYFVKYIQGMKQAGITIDAITIQNEPLHPGNNPSLLLPAPDEAEFIKNHLGPAFKAAKIKTKIIIYDHNADRPDYPISILNDAVAAKYIDGSAFHLYGGVIENVSAVHDAHPKKSIYFTEQMVVEKPNSDQINIRWPVKNLLIGATRNWCRNVLLWNLAADSQNKPFTDRGGCDACQGAVTINGDTVTKNIAYYIIAHAAKFTRPGSVRIGSSNSELLSNVAFKTPEGKIVLLVLNNTKNTETFNIRFNKKSITTSLKSGSVSTYIW